MKTTWMILLGFKKIENEDENFKKCHFKFDQYVVSEDQEKKIEGNVKLAKKKYLMKVEIQQLS